VRGPGRRAGARLVIIYLSRAAHAYTIRHYLESWGRALRDRVAPIAYEALPALGSLPARSTVIFTDLERVPLDQLAVLSALHARLREAGARTLNDPTRTLRRYDLSRALREAGVNEHDVHRLDEGRPIRFPAFLRFENDHDGARSPLLPSRAALDAAVASAVAKGARRADLLVVEFCDVRGPDGLFRKLGVQVVGDRVIPRHLFASDRRWMLKAMDRVDAPRLREERRFTRENPHEEALRAIFRRTGVEFGRVDYAVRRDGGLEVFEVNTNPHLLSAALHAKDAGRVPVHERFAAAYGSALRALDPGGPLEGGARVEVPAGLALPLEAPPPRRSLAERLLSRGRAAPGLLRYYALRGLRRRG